MARATASTSPSVCSPASKYFMTAESISGAAPGYTALSEPSTEITVPSSTVVPPAVKRRRCGSTMISSAPHTHTLPIPRATHCRAALVLPPRRVSTACAATMPGRSSGVVSSRTRTTFSPTVARRTASAESNTAAPTAAPGEAGMPCASGSPTAEVSNRGNISRASPSPPTRASPSSAVMSPSSVNSAAMVKAASAVRLPTRVCSIHNRPRSMVNSMSHRSR
ncbi:hypothetical protein SALBM217S_09671 [Streptomyces griseoloalbus]